MGEEREAFVHELRSSTGALARARHRFEQWLSSQAVSSEDCEDLTVAMSELGANAVNATGDGRAHAAIAIRAWIDRTEVVLEVENAQQTPIGSIVFHGDGDPLRGSGRGLAIVAAFTDTVEVIPPARGQGLIVRCRKHCSPRASA